MSTYDLLTLERTNKFLEKSINPNVKIDGGNWKKKTIRSVKTSDAKLFLIKL